MLQKDDLLHTDLFKDMGFAGPVSQVSKQRLAKATLPIIAFAPHVSRDRWAVSLRV